MKIPTFLLGLLALAVVAAGCANVPFQDVDAPESIEIPTGSIAETDVEPRPIESYDFATRIAIATTMPKDQGDAEIERVSSEIADAVLANVADQMRRDRAAKVKADEQSETAYRYRMGYRNGVPISDYYPNGGRLVPATRL